MGLPAEYTVMPPVWPDQDLSGAVGQRLLRLLAQQTRRNLACLERDRRAKGIEDGRSIVADIPPYSVHFLGGCVYAFMVLARFGGDHAVATGLSAAQLEDTAEAILRALARVYEESEKQPAWPRFSAGRFLHLVGMGAWLLWERLDADMRERTARLLASEADRFVGTSAPHQLYDDTQAESNAWTAGGLATASCMLRQHPQRQRWEATAKAWMISAYATDVDVHGDRMVDGKPLREWLSGPNAFPDYAVENHGFVHPDYLAAVSEMVRAAISYKLAGEPLPQAVMFNAEHAFDLLAFLMLPDGTHLYVQGTDYTPRRVDSFFQACDLVPLAADLVRMACFLRSLEVVETMAAAGDAVPMSGWLGIPYDLGMTWGLTQNYLMCRLFGGEQDSVPDAELEQRLSGVHHSESGCFTVHRTPLSLSSFSWHARTKPPRVMGLTMPLDRDVLVYPMPWSMVGEVCEGADGTAGRLAAALDLVLSRVAAGDDGFSLVLELLWCSGKVRQNCAFVSLPDGRSIYLEERTALADVAIARAYSGTVTLFDDLRWPLQTEPRRYRGEIGELAPSPSALHTGSWLNIDDRLGYAVLGADGFHLCRVAGKPAIWRGDSTMYDTCRLRFDPVPGAREAAAYEADERISRFVMVSCPNQTAEQTANLDADIRNRGWLDAGVDGLAVRVPPFTVRADFATGTVVCET